MEQLMDKVNVDDEHAHLAQHQRDEDSLDEAHLPSVARELFFFLLFHAVNYTRGAVFLPVYLGRVSLEVEQTR